MKIYTKTGDKGKTSLIGGTRVAKSDVRIEAYGTVDELNSYIGLVRDQEVNCNRADILKEIQDRLFTIGASLASDPVKSKMKTPDLHNEDVLLLEQEIDNYTSEVPPLRAFVLPGGHQSVSFCHVARCVCRRAERIAIQLQQESEVEDLVIIYLNRLSDYLFALCRIMTHELGAEEIAWKARI
ncbi:cob(I)yrinic acid a,c-diamide adenosyltransferase [Pontibacter arcticus]|uniref:Corrinoid adenosyltransferase n=1 Tax=Pontibacter arcticus TaxID=2080288 RepID=A0A364RH45_9BACT|nr:cob(I)yrinic acid a,c-diamide adenosyltransferase [Pontibacter arcticus]RAU83638.1 cob(I)yrinic acid a,c-diamide adenosyltransferase [Pontibacter arcticus]